MPWLGLPYRVKLRMGAIATTAAVSWAAFSLAGSKLGNARRARASEPILTPRRGVTSRANSGTSTRPRPGPATAYTAKRVLVIGAGPAGIAALHAFAELDRNGVPRPYVKCYEQQPTPGGQWTGARPYSSMYPGMWLNAPIYFTEFPFYTYAEHFRGAETAFMPRAAVEDYMLGAVTKDGIGDFIAYNTTVTSVRHNPGSMKFSVDSNSPDACTTAEEFDRVIIASGYYTHPRQSTIAGFGGEQVHSHSWAGPAKYKGKKVLVVGNGDSAWDITTLLLKFGASSVEMSIRDEEEHEYLRGIRNTGSKCTTEDGFAVSVAGMGAFYPKIRSASGSRVYFVDGANTSGIDAIVWATGYEPVLPYLEPSLRLSHEEQLDGQLYGWTLFAKNTQLSYIGATYHYNPPQRFSAEAAFVAAVAAGLVDVPPVVSAEACVSLVTGDHRLRKEGEKPYVEHMPAFCDYPEYGRTCENIGEWFEIPDELCYHELPSPSPRGIIPRRYMPCETAEEEAACNASAMKALGSGGENGCHDDDHIPHARPKFWEVGQAAWEIGAIEKLYTMAQYASKEYAPILAVLRRGHHLYYAKAMAALQEGFEADLEERMKRGNGKSHSNDGYYDDVTDDGGCGNKTVITTEGSFRDATYSSWHTSRTLRAHHTPYHLSRDDSLQCYLDKAACRDNATAGSQPISSELGRLGAAEC